MVRDPVGAPGPAAQQRTQPGGIEPENIEPGERDPRTEQLRQRLSELEDRIRSACVAADRSPSDVTTIVVSKTWPAADIRRLWHLGVREFGENRDQEARAKANECADLDLRWHFIGQLQRKKANSVARYADYIHSVDRVELVTALDAAAARAGRRLGCLVQVSLGDRTSLIGVQRGGIDPAELEQLCEAVAGSEQLDLAGLMAVAPLGDQPESAFERLAGLRASIRQSFPQATWLSAGMSSDLEAAIAAGATHVRVGSAVLGERANVR